MFVSAHSTNWWARGRCKTSWLPVLSVLLSLNISKVMAATKSEYHSMCQAPSARAPSVSLTTLDSSTTVTADCKLKEAEAQNLPIQDPWNTASQQKHRSAQFQSHWVLPLCSTNSDLITTHAHVIPWKMIFVRLCNPPLLCSEVLS